MRFLMLLCSSILTKGYGQVMKVTPCLRTCLLARTPPSVRR